MADVQIYGLPNGTVAGTWYVAADDASGAGTYRVTVASIVALVTDASQLTTGTLAAARLPATVVFTGDSRLTDSRAPTNHKANHATGGGDALSPSDIGAASSTHSHGNITSAGAIGSTPGLPVITTTGGALTVGAFGASSGQFCQGNDSRLSDSRAPTGHKASHEIGGSDEVRPVVVSPSALTTNQNNWSPGRGTTIRVTSTGNVTITGVDSTGYPDGAVVTFVNENADGGGVITFAHESGSSTAANRIRSAWKSDAVAIANGGRVTLELSSAASRWRVV